MSTISRALSTFAAAASLCACSSSPTGPIDCSNLPLAPESARVDLAVPTFSSPLGITNPLFPISSLHSAVLLGTSEGLPFRTETTLLPTAKTISVNGRSVQALESQYVAYLDGRIHEVALDWYAQADDGSVWYLGEDVFNYEDGVVADRHGTWMAGRDGPAAMIMPAAPRVGDVYRPENVCGVVFEEVTVKAVGVTVTGPTGPVSGAITVSELHMEGDREDKTFAPGYGEFFSGSGGDSEALAVAVPTDALSTAIPQQVMTLFDGATSINDAVPSNSWTAIANTLNSMNSAWTAYRTGTPPLLATAMTNALSALENAVNARNANSSRIAAIQAARAALDFRLRHRPPTEIDRLRFDLWAAEVIVDAAASNAAFVRGDVTALEWTRSRFANTLSSSTRTQIDGILIELRTAADAGNLPSAASAAARLRTALATSQ